MKKFSKFVLFLLLPLALVAIVSFIFNQDELDTIFSAKIIVSSFIFFSIIAFGSSYVTEYPIIKSKKLFQRLALAALVVFVILLISSFILHKIVYNSLNYKTPTFQALLGVCVFVLEFLIVHFYDNFNKNSQLEFSDSLRLYFKIIFLISISEYVLFAIMSIDMLAQASSFSQFLQYSLPMLVLPVLINTAVFLSLKYLNSFIYFKTNLLATFSLSVVITLIVANLYNVIRFKFVLQANLLYFILVLFSTLLMVTIVRHRDQLARSKNVIASLGNSMAKKNQEYVKLRQQVNPHFLFNNLNTLISFIEINPKKAIEFGQHLANTYRYYLKSEEEDFVNLQDELNFIADYLEIYKAKFENGFSYKIEGKAAANAYVLSLTLQELIDNIFKHNALDESSPLSIVIAIQNDILQISNSKSGIEVLNSTKSGLNTIQKRYEFLTENTIEIQNDQDFFSIKIPILNVTI